MFTLNCRGKLLHAQTALVMGIINVTPDSFFDQSRVMGRDSLLSRAGKMLAEGADILDVGGQSTRPGAEQVGIDEERRRTLSAIRWIKDEFPEAIISVDTFVAQIAQEAVQAGASIVNDIGGGSLDPEMLRVVAGLNVPYVCMHMKGSPSDMQDQVHYDNLMRELLDYFIERIEACRVAGILDCIVDPGFGFAKTIRHNFEILQNLPIFHMLGRPLLVGISRKSTIYRTLGIQPSEALNGTTVLNTVALLRGAGILRVHDVAPAKEAIRLITELQA